MKKGVIATEDRQILDLFAARDEKALKAVSRKYGGACRHIAAEILHSEEDAKEVFNDALFNLWNAIPPAGPEDLFAYLCTVVRRLAYQKREKQRAKKRGGGLPELSLEDNTARQFAAKNSVEQLVDDALFIARVNSFLSTLSPDARTVFLHHYVNGRTIGEIAEAFEVTYSKVAVSLMRTRIRLRKFLKEEELL